MFYLLIAQNDQTQAAYAYQTYNEALSAFHSELAYRNEGRTKTMCAIISSNGSMLKSECYEANSNEEE